jgi:hypothetical protein
VGLPLFAVFYLLLFLPVGLAWFRAYFEMDALRFELREGLKRGMYTRDSVIVRATAFGNTVCSGSYGWPLPKSWGVRMFERAADKVLKEAA